MRIFLLIALLISTPAFAEDEPTKSAQVDVIEERDIPVIRKKTYRDLTKAQKDIDKNKLDKAEKRLRKLLDKSDLNRYELANVYNTLAFVQYKRDDYASAMKSYELVIAQSPQIPLKFEQNTHYTLGQIALLKRDYEKAKHHFESYVSITTEPNPTVDRWLLEAYSGLEQFDEGEMALERYLEHLSQQGKEPNERLLEIIGEYKNR